MMQRADKKAKKQIEQALSLQEVQVFEFQNVSFSELPDRAAPEKQVEEKYIKKYKVEPEAIWCDATRIEHIPKVKLSSVPLDILYNEKINLLKAMQFNGISSSFVPIKFDLEHESFAKNDAHVVTYSTSIRQVDLKLQHTVEAMHARHDNTHFERQLLTSRPGCF